MAGKDRYMLFEAGGYVRCVRKIALQLEADLSAALQNRQFFLLYQPIVDLPSREVVGLEALIRWRHPTRGVLLPESLHSPGRGERGDPADRPLGLEEACRQAGAWAAWKALRLASL